MNKKYLFFIIFGYLMSFYVSHSFGCRGPIQPFEENLSLASTVFTGRILSVNDFNPDEKDSLKKKVEIKFEVDRYWKGTVGKNIKVVSEIHSCGFARGGYREINEKWLILAGGEEELSTWLLAGNVWLEFDINKPTEHKIPKLIFEELGEGQIPQ